jgi:peptidoglycan/xylan/chitin deacetylase (PgdA/CDA1 family)
MPKSRALLFLLLFFLGFLCGHIATRYLVGSFLKNPSKSISAPAPVDLPITSPQNNSVAPTDQPEKSVTVPILMYHYIRVVTDPNDTLGYSLSVTPTQFASQLDYLDQSGYTTVTLDDVVNNLKSSQPLPKKPIVLTFDDGYSDFYTNAFPELKKRNMKATAYIITGLLNDREGRYLTTSQLKELDQSGLITIGDHTVEHSNLATDSFLKASAEIINSKKKLEGLLGHPVTHFCYPSGKWSDSVIGILQKSGFETATTTETGLIHKLSDRLTWSRVRVSGKTNLQEFEEALNPTGNTHSTHPVTPLQ